MATNNATNTSNPVSIAQGGSNAASFTQSNGIVTYNGTRLVNYAGPQIDSSGRMTNTAQPSFSAYLSANVTNVTGDGSLYQIIFDTELFDNASNYNNSTGVFTAPVTGKYFFTCAVQTQNQGTSNLEVLTITCTSGVFNYVINPTGILYVSGNYSSSSFSAFIDLTATDTTYISITLDGAVGKTVGLTGSVAFNTYFSGYLVC